eukprot:8985447-Alexandrium_andersonii.AAC.1
MGLSDVDCVLRLALGAVRQYNILPDFIVSSNSVKNSAAGNTETFATRSSSSTLPQRQQAQWPQQAGCTAQELEVLEKSVLRPWKVSTTASDLS